MTFNKDYKDCKSCESNNELIKCKPNHPTPQNILLECGEGTGSRIFTSSDDAPFQLAHVALDTSCLNSPEVLIKFSSLVRVEILNLLLNLTVRLKYELFKICDGKQSVSLGTWMFEKVNASSIFFNSIEESFSFIFCECGNCHDCCEYFVTVTPIEITNAITTVNNGRLAALSQSLYDFSNKLKYLDTEDKNIKSNQKHPKAKEVLLECGQGNGAIVFREPTDPSSNIAHVNIDTTCLSRPKVLIDFSSTIKFDFGAGDLILQFELFRVCDDGEKVLRGIWMFERTGVNIASLIDESFSFIFCDSLTCPGCCEYFVTVTVLQIRIFPVLPDAFVLVDNGRMTALAQSTMDCNNDENEICNDKCDCINYERKHPIPKSLLLECGSGTGSRTFTPSSNKTPFQLAHVTIDTTSLYKPVVNIEFSSIVSFENTTVNLSADGRLQYELFRACDNKEPISIGVWSISRRELSTFEIDRITTAFDFTFCDCTTCPSCCDYFVVVTPIGIRTTGISEDFKVTVSNGRIAALAQEG